MSGRIQFWLGASATAVAALVIGCGTDMVDETETSNDALTTLQDLSVEYAKQTEVDLGDGVRAILGKGGNSVVVFEDDETLVFDTKFGSTWPVNGASALRTWIDDHVKAPVTKIVNSHYHYDHTWGNALYPHAEVYAHADSRALMLAVDPEVWGTERSPRAGLPTKKLDAVTIIPVGKRSVEVHLAGSGHTSGDAWMRIPRESLGERAESDVIVTGDLAFHSYYPLFEEGKGGSSISGNIEVLRHLAATYPEARFVPGHGSLCTANDIQAYADYLQEVLDAVHAAQSRGLDEDSAVRDANPERWKRVQLPSPHHGVTWATAESSFRSAYRIVKNGDGK